MKTLSIEDIKIRMYKIHGDFISIQESTYLNTNTKAKFTDIIGNEWWARVSSVLEGRLSKNLQHRNRTTKIKDIKEKIKKIHGDTIIIDENSYVNTKVKAKFIDRDHGEWWTKPYKILQGQGHKKRVVEKRAQTCIKRYGKRNPNQVPEIALKIAKNSNNSHIKFHWKTNEELVCKASYEAKTVDYLNENKIEFDWQPKTFTMPNGKTYRPDLFLTNENKWIEIKGWMRPNSQIKWDWFQTVMPNSELWGYKKLKEMNIL